MFPSPKKNVPWKNLVIVTPCATEAIALCGCYLFLSICHPKSVFVQVSGGLTSVVSLRVFWDEIFI